MTTESTAATADADFGRYAADMMGMTAAEYAAHIAAIDGWVAGLARDLGVGS